jgi:DNA-directed RNA polymerase specialized sigma24 family protein
MNSIIVEQVYKKHHSWLIAVSYNFTQDKDKAEELTQNLYLRLLELPDINKIKYKGDINLYYLYKMIRSSFLNENKKQINVLPINEDIIEYMEDVPYDYDTDNQHEQLITDVRYILDNDIDWFSSLLLKVYLDDDHSIESLHKETRISKSTIWSSLNKTKKFIKNKINETR